MMSGGSAYSYCGIAATSRTGSRMPACNSRRFFEGDNCSRARGALVKGPLPYVRHPTGPMASTWSARPGELLKLAFPDHAFLRSRTTMPTMFAVSLLSRFRNVKGQDTERQVRPEF